jgi:uncharacterized protein YbjT (DUF2867 family)
MSEKEIHAVTGAFGFTGKYIAQRLLRSGVKLKTLTNSPRRPNPFGNLIEVFPFNFEEPDKLRQSLEGVKVLYNTYWVRFNYRNFTFDQAIKNSRILFSCARDAGVKRIVHISITNNSLDSPFEYFKGKAIVENELQSSGISYAILRPAVLFGNEDILINNIAWALRRFPVFMLFGNGNYRLQPIHVDDLAGIAKEQGGRAGNVIIDAIGPETYSFKGLVREIGRAIGKSRPMFKAPPELVYLITRVSSALLGDVLLTRDEIRGLMAEMLFVDSAPLGKTAISEWVRDHSDTLGKKYRSELKRRKDRVSPYSGY